MRGCSCGAAGWRWPVTRRRRDGSRGATDVLCWAQCSVNDRASRTRCIHISSHYRVRSFMCTSRAGCDLGALRPATAPSSAWDMNSGRRTPDRRPVPEQVGTSALATLGEHNRLSMLATTLRRSRNAVQLSPALRLLPARIAPPRGRCKLCTVASIDGSICTRCAINACASRGESLPH